MGSRTSDEREGYCETEVSHVPVFGPLFWVRSREFTELMSRNPTATNFPVKPTRKPYNATARATMSVDYNDIFRVSDIIHFDTDDDEYRKARLAYGMSGEGHRNLWS